jgi:peptide chain release factor
MTKEKKLLFSVTKDDCDWQTFRAGGPGGQHQNKVESAVRCIHRDSGATGESRTERSQHINRQLAFERMGNTRVFQDWAKIEASRRLGGKSVHELVEEAMDMKNMRVEVRGEDGKWEIASNA